jgi:hypothetical protein
MFAFGKSRQSKSNAARTATLKRASEGIVKVEALENRRMLSVTPDPGATFATAYNLGAITGGNSFSDHVGPSDVADTYSFFLTNPGTLYFRLRSYNAPSDVRLYKDVGTNGSHMYALINGGTVNNIPAAGEGNFHDAVTPGQYYLQVSSVGQETDYLLRATADFAGETLSTARDIGALQPGLQTYSDEVGSDFIIDSTQPKDVYHDPLDVYKFKVSQTEDVSFNVALGTGFVESQFFNVHADVVKDANHNGVVDAGEVLASSSIGGNEPIAGLHLTPGTYFVRVDAAGTTYPNYVLSINTDRVGDSAAAAKNVGTLFGQQEFDESVSDRDGSDYYRFRFDQPGDFKADLSGLSDEAGVELQDSAGHNLVFSNPVGSAPRSIETSLNPGTYYVVVYDAGANFGTNYSLRLTADYAGDGYAVARNIGTLSSNGSKFFQDFIGNGDTAHPGQEPQWQSGQWRHHHVHT